MVPAGNANAEMLDNNELSQNATVQAEQVVNMIEIVFEPLESIVPGIVDKMIDIGDCESGLNQLRPNRTLIVNPDPNSSAAGVFQILLITHKPDYQRENLNPAEVADNIQFARFMVERKIGQGRNNVYEDWVCA